MIKLPESLIRDADELRKFYQSVGISEHTIERAIAARAGEPVEEPSPKAKLPRGAKRKAVAQTSR